MAVVGLTIGIGADASAFNKEIKKMDKNMRDTSREAGDLSKSLQFEWNADRFAEAQKKAQEALQQTEVKAKALKDRLKYLEESGTDKQSAEYQKLQSELIKTETKAVMLKEKLQEIKDLKIEELAQKFDKVGAGITKAGQALTPLSAAAAGLLAAFSAIGLSTVKTADDLKTFADQVNLSATTLQKWQYIAMQTDVSQQDLQNALIKTQNAFGGLAKGDIDSYAQALLDLGFTQEDATKGMAENFDILIEKIMAIEDPMLQASYANEIFGQRMGAKLIPMLNSGGEGLAALSEEFSNFNTLTEEQIGSLADFDNVMNNIKFSFQTIRDQIGVALLPVMEEIAVVINERIIPAINSMVEWFGTLSTEQLNNMVIILASVAALAPVLLIVGKLTSGIGGLIKTVGMLGKALTFLSAHPIIAIIGIVIALMALMYARNEQFRESVNHLVSTLSSALMPILNLVIKIFIKIFNAILPLIDLLAELLVPVLDWVSDAIVKWMGFIEKVLNGFIDFINLIIRQINKLGDVLGITINELENIKLTGEITSVEGTESIDLTAPTLDDSLMEDITADVPFEYSPEQIIQDTTIEGTPDTVINNDYSDKDIIINITVENYSEQVDVDSLIEEINIKMAEAM